MIRRFLNALKAFSGLHGGLLQGVVASLGVFLDSSGGSGGPAGCILIAILRPETIPERRSARSGATRNRRKRRNAEHPIKTEVLERLLLGYKNTD